MASRVDRRKRIKNPDGYGKRTGECGDTIEMFLIVDGEKIRNIFFDTDGCLNTSACANTVSLLSEGKNIDDAWDINAEDIIDYLESLPSEENHCAELAVGAFYLALRNFMELKKSPWKKIYTDR